MVGYLRFVLAGLVVWSHLNFPLWEFLGIRINQGVYAVFAFYIISGFFTAAIFDRHQGKNQLRDFYVDRTLRIYPLFLGVIAITGLIGIFHYEPGLRASPGDYREWQVWMKGALQPFNGLVSFFFGGDFPYGPFFAFTPVASLALEVNYFAIYPVFRRLRYLIVVLAAAASVTLLISLLAAGNANDIENYSYRFLIGVLPTFLTGYLVYRNLSEPTALRLRGWFVSLVLGLALVIAIKYLNPVSTKWVGEMGLALLTTPALLILALRFKPLRYDNLFGYLAYGIFLVHIPVIRYLHLKRDSDFNFIYAMLIATAISWVLHFILEKPIIRLRHRFGRVKEIRISS
jgi:peptidoglycan/LPS O-acetylase OafA/YrhL